MDLVFLRRFSLIAVVAGLILIYLCSPAQLAAKSSISALQKNCFGSVEVEGTVTKLIYSSNAGLTAELTQNKSKIMVFLRDWLVDKGDNISISGKASKFSNQCWLFPDKVELR